MRILVVNYENAESGHHPLLASITQAVQSLWPGCTVDYWDVVRWDVSDYDVAIVHGQNSTQDIISNRRTVEFLRKGGVLIFSSSEPLLTIQPETRRGCSDSGVGFDYCFFGIQRGRTHGHYLSLKEWKSLLCWAEALRGESLPLNDILDRMPDDVARLILPPRSLDYLCAIYILCQGYLVAHTAACCDDDCSSDVLLALTRIGWTNAAFSESGTRLEDAWIKCKTSSWWIEGLGGHTRESLQSEIDYEFVKDPEKARLTPLLGKIFGDKNLDDRESVTSVLDAFQTIKRKLEAWAAG